MSEFNQSTASVLPKHLQLAYYFIKNNMPVQNAHNLTALVCNAAEQNQFKHTLKMSSISTVSQITEQK